jgi:hypothetical protein
MEAATAKSSLSESRIRCTTTVGRRVIRARSTPPTGSRNRRRRHGGRSPWGHLKAPQGRNQSVVPLPANMVAGATTPGTPIVASSSSGCCRRLWAHRRRRWGNGQKLQGSAALPERCAAGRRVHERPRKPDDARSGDNGYGGGGKRERHGGRALQILALITRPAMQRGQRRQRGTTGRGTAARRHRPSRTRAAT